MGKNNDRPPRTATWLEKHPNGPAAQNAAQGTSPSAASPFREWWQESRPGQGTDAWLPTAAYGKGQRELKGLMKQLYGAGVSLDDLSTVMGNKFLPGNIMSIHDPKGSLKYLTQGLKGGTLDAAEAQSMVDWLMTARTDREGGWAGAPGGGMGGGGQTEFMDANPWAKDMYLGSIGMAIAPEGSPFHGSVIDAATGLPSSWMSDYKWAQKNQGFTGTPEEYAQKVWGHYYQQLQGLGFTPPGGMRMYPTAPGPGAPGGPNPYGNRPGGPGTTPPNPLAPGQPIPPPGTYNPQPPSPYLTQLPPGGNNMTRPVPTGPGYTPPVRNNPAQPPTAPGGWGNGNPPRRQFPKNRGSENWLAKHPNGPLAQPPRIGPGPAPQPKPPGWPIYEQPPTTPQPWGPIPMPGLPVTGPNVPPQQPWVPTPDPMNPGGYRPPIPPKTPPFQPPPGVPGRNY